MARGDLGVYFASNGRIAEARAESAKCREVDPIRSEPLENEAIINYHARNYKVLTEVCRAYTTAFPNYWVGLTSFPSRSKRNLPNWPARSAFGCFSLTPLSTPAFANS